MADFSKIPVQTIEGNEEYIDIRKPLGNALYYKSQDLAGSELGRKIYLSTGNIDITDKEKELVKEMCDNMFAYVTRNAIIKSL